MFGFSLFTKAAIPWMFGWYVNVEKSAVALKE